MKDYSRLLDFSTRLAYSIPFFSNELKLLWSRLTDLYFFQHLSVNQIQYTVNHAAAKPFVNASQINAAAKNLTREEKSTALALLVVLGKSANNSVITKRIHGFISELQPVIQSSDSHDKIENETDAIWQVFRQHENRPLIKVPARIWPLVLDYFLRWVALALFYNGVIEDSSYLMLSNFIFIPIIFLIILYLTRRELSKKRVELFKPFGGIDKFKIRYEVSAWHYTVMAFFIGSGAYIAYLIQLNSIPIALFFIVYYWISLRYFPLGVIPENALAQQLRDIHDQRKAFSPDENDEAIVSLESQLTATTSRLEAYVLESALFGALAFSGFLQIMSEGLIGFEQLENFATQVSYAAHAVISFSGEEFYKASTALETTSNLLCLVSVQTLFCSVFFLTVIASRLRFSNVADQVREFLNQANAYNRKEEAILENKEHVDKDRLGSINEKVNDYLQKAERAMEKVRPVMGYMQYFRNAGILTFLILLVSSSLFISNTLALVFIFLALATLIYFNRNVISISAPRFLNLKFRQLVFSKGHWLLVGGFGFMALAFFFRTIVQITMDELLAIGVFMLGVYGFIWMIFIPHHDPKYGDVMRSGKDEWRDRKWILIRNILGVSFFVSMIGYVFKSMHVTGADESLVPGILLFSLTFIFAGYYLAKKRWMGIVTAWLMATGLVGILFKLLHLTGADEMLLLGALFQLVILIFLIFTRKYFHAFFLKIFFLIFSINMTFFFGLTDKLMIAYEHAILSPKAVNEIEILHPSFFRSVFLGDRELSEDIAACNAYIRKYGSRFGYTSIYRRTVFRYAYQTARVLEQEASRVTEKDLEHALLSAKQINVIGETFQYEYPDINYCELEAWVLMRLGRTEEAIGSLEKIRGNRPQYEQEEINQRIEKIKRGETIDWSFSP